MTRNAALRGAAWLSTLIIAIPLAPVLHAAALGVQIGIGAATLIDVGGEKWATQLYLTAHPEAETYAVLTTVAILIGLGFLVSKIFVALWGRTLPEAPSPSPSLAPSLAELQQYRREREGGAS